MVYDGGKEVHGNSTILRSYRAFVEEARSLLLKAID